MSFDRWFERNKHIKHVVEQSYKQQIFKQLAT